MKLVLAILSFLISSGIEFGGIVEFDRVVHDFGKVGRDDGELVASFNVRNNSSEPVTIYSVVSSCGCTVASWTRESIPSGGSGQVEVTYLNDEGPYPFDKTVKVYVSGLQKPVTLHVKGIVD
ncbi:MAG: DUF1573 domain-containing protein [Bacteroidales bacterium]|nr:DUF1573 domain-containing protein [Bacteroidales bacterium]